MKWFLEINNHLGVTYPSSSCIDFPPPHLEPLPFPTSYPLCSLLKTQWILDSSFGTVMHLTFLLLYYHATAVLSLFVVTRLCSYKTKYSHVFPAQWYFSFSQPSFLVQFSQSDIKRICVVIFKFSKYTWHVFYSQWR